MKLKKLCVFAVLAVFIVGMMPMAFADKPVRQDSDDLKAIKNAVGKAVGKGKQLTILAANAVDNANLVKNKTKVNLSEAKNKLVNVQKEVKKYRKLLLNYEQIKEKYQKAKEKYQISREKVLSLKKEIQKCKDGNCVLKKKQYRNKTKDHLVNLADVILRTLDKLKKRIESSSLADKDDLLNDLEEKIHEITDAKEDLQDITGEITADEIKDAIKTIKDSWGKTKPKVKLGTGRLIQAKLGNIVVSIGKLEKKFEKIRDRLEGKGYDISDLDDYLDDLTDKLASAKIKWEKAKEKFQEAKDATDIKEAQTYLREAHEYQKKARDLIKEARNEIRKIVKEIKELQGNLGGGNETETNEEDEEENETDDNETENNETIG